jgi:hypothetical protein
MSHVKNVLMEVRIVWKNVRGVSYFVNNAYQLLEKSNDTFMSIETKLNVL